MSAEDGDDAGGDGGEVGDSGVAGLIEHFNSLIPKIEFEETTGFSTPGKADRVRTLIESRVRGGKDAKEIGKELYAKFVEANDGKSLERPTEEELVQAVKLMTSPENSLTLLEAIEQVVKAATASHAAGVDVSLSSGSAATTEKVDLSAVPEAERAKILAAREEAKLAVRALDQGGAVVTGSGSTFNNVGSPTINVNIPDGAGGGKGAEEALKFVIEQQKAERAHTLEMMKMIVGAPRPAAEYVVQPQHYDPAAHPVPTPSSAAPAPSPAATAATSHTAPPTGPKPWNVDWIYKEIRRNPEAQLHDTQHAGAATTLSGQASDYAIEKKPWVPVPNTPPPVYEDDSRKVFNVKPVQEGPIFMPRLLENGQAAMDPNTKKIIYDILYFDEHLNLDTKRSFIAPDGVPEKTKSSVVKSIRDQCLGYNQAQFKQKEQDAGKNLGWPPEERGSVMAHAASVAQAAKAHVAPPSRSGATTTHKGFTPGLDGLTSAKAAATRAVSTIPAESLVPPPPPPPMPGVGAPPPPPGASGAPSGLPADPRAAAKAAVTPAQGSLASGQQTLNVHNKLGSVKLKSTGRIKGGEFIKSGKFDS